LCAKTERVLDEGNRKLLESGCASFFGWMPQEVLMHFIYNKTSMRQNATFSTPLRVE
jgi:hypothetical protein